MYSSFRHATRTYLLAAVALSAFGVWARAQSTDVGTPTPVYSNQLSGRIAPRDVGDARLTRHFYAFNGTEGDLHVSVESTDLNGDVDVFTASTLRPLLKITLYAVGSASTRVNKSVYIRADEPLILRVEGRTVTDADAQYRIRLDGAFRPAAGTPPQLAEAETPSADSEAGSRGRRTSSTGARLPETAAEREAREAREAAAAAAEAEAARARAEAEEARRLEAEREASRRAEAAAAEPTPPRTTGTRGTRGATTRRGSRRTRPAATDPPADRTDEERASDAERSSEASAAETPSAPEPAAPRTTRRGATRRGARGTRRGETTAENPPAENSAGTTAPATPDAEAEPSPRLIIVTKDGELIARDMKTVRRVTVERGQIVVTGMDGRVERVPMSNVVRMAIEP